MKIFVKAVLMTAIIMTTATYTVGLTAQVIEKAIRDSYSFFPWLNTLIFVESSNRPHAVSKKNAIGLMQVTAPVVEDYNTFAGGKYTIDDMCKIKPNIEVGTWQLRRLRKIYSNDIKVVSSYNMGSGRTDENIYNISYLFRILGTNHILNWLKNKKTRSWKGSTRSYYVTE